MVLVGHHALDEAVVAAQLLKAPSFELAGAEFDQPRVEAQSVTGARGDALGGVAGTLQRARIDGVDLGQVVVEKLAEPLGLLVAQFIERGIGVAVPHLIDVGVGLAVADEEELALVHCGDSGNR